MGQQHPHLSSEERTPIEKPHCERHPGVRRTAEGIGRDKSTVSRETEARPVVRVQRERGVPPLPGVFLQVIVHSMATIFQQHRRLVFSGNRTVGTRHPFPPGYLVMRACSLQ